jgi:oxygen-independent coproporphyrinogen-3 oxidase
MISSVLFDRDLIVRYDKSGPRYTSYPTALQFHEGFGESHYVELAKQTNEDLIPVPLSLYFHLPFCRSVCFYCACNKIITNNRRQAIPYLNNLHKEIELQGKLFDRDRIVEQLHWGGGTPTFINDDQIRELMSITRMHFTLRNDDFGDYSIEIDPREINEGTIPLLREIGFNRMSIGVQDFDPDVQKAVNRIQTYEITAQALESARKEGFRSINFDLIYGLPLQTLKSFEKTLNKVLELKPDRIALYNYAHLPELFKTQRQINTDELPPASVKLKILKYSIDCLTENGYVYIGMDHFARPEDELTIAQQNGTLHRNFQGYSTYADTDIIGFGITAISKVGDSYSQNVRDIDEYESIIMQGRKPVFRGILLDEDDLLRREVISALICNFKLDYEQIQEQHRINFKKYFSTELDRLSIMEQDGLIELDMESMTVTPTGRLLIRNICMVFDKYIDETTGPGRYSKLI